MTTGDLKEKLKAKLREIFQFEDEDLDFGIYRIMNYKRKEIEKFIEKDLIEQVQEELEVISREKQRTIEEKIKRVLSKTEVKKYLEALEIGDEARAKIYKEDFSKEIEEYERLQEQLRNIKILEELEADIYNHLINFFSRYYDSGDFISKRRYGKNEKYVIPYNGEEVLLYWINKDQYYIKTTEYFRKYTFRIKGLTVNFRVVEAEEEKGNVKSVQRKLFILKTFDFDKDRNVLNIYFEYRGIKEGEEKKYRHGKNVVSQDRANEETVRILKEEIPENSIARIIFENNSQTGKTHIERHLKRYTRRNTSDYFIHKDLKSFLKRELDFYIKNELLGEIEISSGYFDGLKTRLIVVRAFKNIADKIIQFLAQIEDFQKNLWEKKKFVIETHYVITLDKIKEFAGEEFLEEILDEILDNEDQMNEWRDLFGIQVKRKEELVVNNGELKLGGNEWRKLPIDTRYFDEEFKWKLLAALTKNNALDDMLDGILIKSENWQALNLLLSKYYEKVQTIYIDPPFNKEQEADYLYKVGYKDATWITMLENRIRLGWQLLNDRGSIFVRCDYNGNMYVRLLLNEIFGRSNFRNEIIVSRISKQDPKIKKFNTATDSLYFFSKSDNYKFNLLFKKLRRAKGERWHAMDSQGQGQPLYIFGHLFEPPEGRHWTYGQENIKQMEQEGRIRLRCRKCGYIHTSGVWNGCPRCGEVKDVAVEYLLPPTEEKQIDSNWTDIPGYTSNWGFKTENSEILLKRVIESTSEQGDLILDFFLGSGTTAAVAHKLKRKWIGIEMGDHYWTVILPRMKKVLFYDKTGISREKDVKKIYKGGGFFKYQTLEQYEDTLENIEFESPHGTLYELPDYFIKYMLQWETKNSKTYLNVKDTQDPFNYKLKILENYQQKSINVDLIETFNYLIGLKITSFKVFSGDRKYIFVFGEKDGKKIAVVWRSMKDIDLEEDKRIIEENVKDFDEIYINGDAVIKGFKPIELEFKLFERVR